MRAPVCSASADGQTIGDEAGTSDAVLIYLMPTAIISHRMFTLCRYHG